MINLSIQKALQQIKNDALQSVYFVYGQEYYLIEQVKQAFSERLKITNDSLNFANFDCEETDFSIIYEELQAMPFFDDYRLVFMEQPFFLTSDKKSWEQTQIDQLVEYLKNPVPSTILVVFASYEKIDERKKLSKQLKKSGILIDVHPLNETEVTSYIQQYLENEAISFNRETLAYFLKYCDYQLTKAMQELQKINLYLADEKQLTKTIIDQLIPKTLEQNIFELTQNVLLGNKAQALQLFDELCLQGEEPIKMIAILIGQLRLFIQTKFLMSKGYQQANIAEELKIHSYRVKLAMQDVRKYETQRLFALFNQLVELDFQIKTGQVDKYFAFQLFMLKV